MRPSWLLAAAVIATTGAACDGDGGGDATFEAVMETVIEPRCTFSSCHANPTIAANLDLTAEQACDTLINQPSCLFPDRMRVIPGAPGDSFLFHKLAGEQLTEAPAGTCATSNVIMPLGGIPLDDDELALVRDWIAAGASCTPNPDPKPGSQPPVIAAFTASSTAPLAGETITITVTLNKAAPEGGQMIALEMGSGAMSAPVQVDVAAGAAVAKFEAYALRPTSRFTLRATTADSVKELVLRVAGLEVAEVLADPIGADDERQWVKLRNRTQVPIDLNGYVLKAGDLNYGLVSAPLTRMLAPGACALIGGPRQTSSNGVPAFTQPIDFSPDLPHALTGSAGFALFDSNAAPIGFVPTPMDTMIVGANNNGRLVGPDADVSPPYCPTPIAGTSARRTGPKSCVQSAMQPSLCQ